MFNNDTIIALQINRQDMRKKIFQLAINTGDYQSFIDRMRYKLPAFDTLVVRL